jgi:hypothetical protein
MHDDYAFASHGISTSLEHYPRDARGKGRRSLRFR